MRWRAGGTLRSFRNIPVNQLYRLVEGSGLVTVTPGAALPYPCGLPDYDTATEAGIFIAKNCTNGTWQVRMSAGGSTGALNYSGRIVSSADFVSIEPKSVESYDQFDTSNASRIGYVFRTSGNRWDGVDLVPQAGANTCFELDAPAGTAVYMGPLRERVSQRFDLETLGPCT